MAIKTEKNNYSDGTNSTFIVSKQNATVYVNETQTNFKSIGKTMYGDGNDYVKSAMCSGIQVVLPVWDTAMMIRLQLVLLFE